MIYETYAFIAPQIEFSLKDHPERRPSLEIYFVGCKKRCPGCHNKELWEVTPYNSIKVIPEELLNKIKKIKRGFDWINDIIFLGGEPLDYIDFLDIIAKPLKKDLKLNIGIYTGYNENEIDWKREVFNFVDWIKVGEFDMTKRDPNYYLASTNQKFIILKKKI